MDLNKILVTTLGAGLIAFIWWFFFGKKSEESSSAAEGGMINVLVDGGYKPSVINLIKGEESTLKIVRRDPNTCLEEIVLPDFKIKKILPLNEEVEIKLTPERSGNFGFHCGMNMYHGKIVVK